MGAAAALVILQAHEEIPPKMIGVQGNQIVEAPLMDCVKSTRDIDKAMQECNFERALQLRGNGFQHNLRISRRLVTCGPSTSLAPAKTPKYRFAVMNVGTPAAGTNSTIRAFVRLMRYNGHTVLGIAEGFEGLLLDCDVHDLGWLEVSGWGSAGGSKLGANRVMPTEETISKIADKFLEHNIQGLLVVGGFEGFASLLMLQKYRELYPAFKIPLLGIAATISNNVPGTDYSLGCDTALNTIVHSCDVLRQSAHASRKRVFIVETMGGYCGYLATMSALAAGADAAYIFEEKFSVANIQKDVACLTRKFRKDGLERGLIMRNERCSVNFTTEFMCQLFSEEGKGVFVTHGNILGHLQHGDRPSPYDRILGVKYASHAVDFFLEQVKKNQGSSGSVQATSLESACMLGIRGTKIETTPLTNLEPDADFEHRIPKQQWWMSLRRLLHVLSKHKEHSFLGEGKH